MARQFDNREKMADLFFAISYYRRRRGMSQEQLAEELEAMPEVDTVTSLATTEAEEKDGETLHLGDKMTPRELAEFADIDIELVDLLYTAYAVDQKEYGHIVGGIDHYGVPLIDMFEFIYDEIQVI